MSEEDKFEGASSSPTSKPKYQTRTVGSANRDCGLERAVVVSDKCEPVSVWLCHVNSDDQISWRYARSSSHNFEPFSECFGAG